MRPGLPRCSKLRNSELVYVRARVRAAGRESGPERTEGLAPSLRLSSRMAGRSGGAGNGIPLRRPSVRLARGPASRSGAGVRTASARGSGSGWWQSVFAIGRGVRYPSEPGRGSGTSAPLSGAVRDADGFEERAGAGIRSPVRASARPPEHVAVAVRERSAGGGFSCNGRAGREGEDDAVRGADSGGGSAQRKNGAGPRHRRAGGSGGIWRRAGGVLAVFA